MSFRGEPCTHCGEQSRCTCSRSVHEHGTDNRHWGNYLHYSQVYATSSRPAAPHDNDLMQDGMNFSPSAPANTYYYHGYPGSGWTGPSAGPAAVVPGATSGPSVFLDANNNAAVPGNANPSNTLLIRTESLPGGATIYSWTDGYNYWTTSLDDPLGFYSSTASTSLGRPPHDAANPNQPTVASPLSSLAPNATSSSGFGPVSHDPQSLIRCDVPGCSGTFGLSKDLKRHRKTVHFTEGHLVWICICGKIQSRKDNHRRHVEGCNGLPTACGYVCVCSHLCAQVDEHLEHLAGCRFGAGPRGRPPRTS